MPADSNGHGNGQSSLYPQAVAVSTNGGSSHTSKRPVSDKLRDKIRDAVLQSLERREKGGVAVEKRPPSGHQQRSFVAPPGLLPPHLRRNLQGNILPQVAPSMMRRPTWTANPLEVAWRLTVYSVAAVRWFVGNMWNVLLRRDNIDRRATRLRQAIERIGGAAVKLGQQMAMRIDLIPYEYTVELSKMLDRMPAFPTSEAMEIIERRTGKRLDQVFESIDPVPVGSASVACVYRAYLITGEQVAVKVRRPGIGQKFVTDCAAMSTVLKILEFFTIIRPGLSQNFVFEFRSMLLEEANFSEEGRNAELFRRGVKKNLKYISAPRVFHEFTSEETLVTEFVTGIWLRELIVAVENKDEASLSILRSHGIHPDVVARRLLRANHFGMFENMLFHADPHPSNVVVQENSRVVFIDFGSCGAYTTRERNNWRQLVYYHNKEDIGRMVQAALAILEPLPPVDIDEFSKRVEMVFWQDLYAFKSKHAEWWERTSARIWINFLALAREYGIPLNLNTLRMIRSTLLYETISARIYPKVSNYHEHKMYNKNAGKRARKRVRRQLWRWMCRGLSNTEYLQVEQVFDMGNRVMYLAQRWLDAPPFRFSLLVDKAVFAISVLMRGGLTFVFSTLSGGFALVAYKVLHLGQSLDQVDFGGACLELLHWRSYQFLVGLVVFLNIRRIMFRFFDKDIKSGTSGLT